VLPADVDSLGRWPGSKRWLPVLYSERIPSPSPRGRAFDVFTGAGALAIHWLKEGRRVVMADANPRLIGCYRAIRDHSVPFVDAMRSLEARYRGAEQGGEDAAKACFEALRSEMNASEPRSIDKDDEHVTITFDADDDLNKEIVERATELLKAGPWTIGDLVRALNGTSE